MSVRRSTRLLTQSVRVVESTAVASDASALAPLEVSAAAVTATTTRPHMKESKPRSRKRVASERDAAIDDEAALAQSLLSRATTLTADWRGSSSSITGSHSAVRVKRRSATATEDAALSTAAEVTVTAVAAAAATPSPAALQQTWLVGAHVSAAGGPHRAVENAFEGGCQSFALFLRQKMSWNSKPLSDEDVLAFKAACVQHGFDASRQVLPHGIYIVNLASPNEETAAKSVDVFTDEVKRCQRLGISRLNIHPGSTVGGDKRIGIQTIARVINQVHTQTSGVTVVLENMAGQGSCIGGTFQDLRDIIDLIKDRTRIGVCLDTCHLFAAGYDIRTAQAWENVLREFDATVGLRYLCGMHLNDSKGDLGCHLDRHENIGKGKIGAECFRFVMNDLRFRGIPLILETPACATDEVALLNGLRKHSLGCA